MAALVLPVQSVNRLYSFVRVSETSEHLLQGNMIHVTTLSFHLNSGSLNTIADVSSLVNQLVISQKELKVSSTEQVFQYF